MNISRLSTPASLPQVSTRPPHHQHHHVRSAADGDADDATTLASAADASVQAGGEVQDQGQDYSQRIAAYASRLENRVQNAIDGGSLSADQAQALQDASAQFQQLMNRIGNADFSHSPKREVLYALHQLTSQVQAILHPQETQPGSSADALGNTGSVAAASVTPTIDAVA